HGGRNVDPHHVISRLDQLSGQQAAPAAKIHHQATVEPRFAQHAEQPVRRPDGKVTKAHVMDVAEVGPVEICHGLSGMLLPRSDVSLPRHDYSLTVGAAGSLLLQRALRTGKPSSDGSR